MRRLVRFSLPTLEDSTNDAASDHNTGLEARKRRVPQRSGLGESTAFGFPVPDRQWEGMMLHDVARRCMNRGVQRALNKFRVHLLQIETRLGSLCLWASNYWMGQMARSFARINGRTVSFFVPRQQNGVQMMLEALTHAMLLDAFAMIKIRAMTRSRRRHAQWSVEIRSVANTPPNTLMHNSDFESEEDIMEGPFIMT